MTTSPLRLGVLAALLLGAVQIAPASAASADREMSDLKLSITKLQAEMQAVQRTLYKGPNPVAAQAPAQPGFSGNADDAGFPGESGSAASPAARLVTLEEQLARLTGRLEVLENSQRKLQENFDLFRKDLEARMNTIETSKVGGAAAAAGGPQVLTPVSPAEPAATEPAVVDGAAQAMYDAAILRIRKNDMVGAEAQLEALVAKYPKDPILGNARYWLGEIYYRKQQYGQAAKYYLDGIQKNANSQKAPGLWLKLGMSLSNLGNTADACAAYGELERRFKPVPDDVAPILKSEKQKAKCK